MLSTSSVTEPTALGKELSANFRVASTGTPHGTQDLEISRVVWEVNNLAVQNSVEASASTETPSALLS